MQEMPEVGAPAFLRDGFATLIDALIEAQVA